MSSCKKLRDMDTLLSFSESISEPRINDEAVEMSSNEEAGDISSNDEFCDTMENAQDSNCSETEMEERENVKDSDCNPGWADAMAKILKTSKPKHKRSIVLAKAKKLQDVSKKEKVLDTADASPEDKELKEIEIKQKTVPTKEPKRLKKKLWENKGRVQPHILDRNREKALSKIATKGVVQLFNAVRQQQKKLDQQLKEVKNSELKKDKIIKSIDKKAFLDVLMGKGPVQNDPPDLEQDVKEEEESVNKTWKVLHDDFMTGAKLKDWDKNGLDIDDTAMDE